MARKKQRAPSVKITDLSDETPAPVDNVIFRARVAGFDTDNDRLHQKYRELKALYRAGEARERRKNWVLGSLLVGPATKAIYEMAISPWLSQHWLLNAALVTGILGAIVYLFTPNIRRLWQLSRTREVAADPQEEPSGSPE